MKRFFLALRFLTVYPFGRDDDVTASDLVGSTFYYPVVGGLLGMVLYLFWQIAANAWPSLLAAALTVTLWLLLSAGLHLDGLMDMFDGLGVRGDLPRRLEVMRDSRVGAFGAQAAVVSIVLKVAAVFALAESGMYMPALILAPVAGRTAMVALMATCGYAREGEGLGRVFVEMTGKRQLWIVLIVSLLIGLATLGYGIIGLLLSQVVVFLLFRHFVRNNFGGVTGDILGAACEVHELALLILVPLVLF